MIVSDSHTCISHNKCLESFLGLSFFQCTSSMYLEDWTIPARSWDSMHTGWMPWSFPEHWWQILIHVPETSEIGRSLSCSLTPTLPSHVPQITFYCRAGFSGTLLYKSLAYREWKHIFTSPLSLQSPSSKKHIKNVPGEASKSTIPNSTILNCSFSTFVKSASFLAS